MGACTSNDRHTNRIKKVQSNFDSNNQETNYPDQSQKNERVINDNIQKQENLKINSCSQDQIQKVDICNSCHLIIKKEQSILIENCKHLYDINCFINHFKEQKSCCPQTVIKINKNQFPKIQVDEIMKHQLNLLVKKIENPIIVRCSNKFCSFLFIYNKLKNTQQSKMFFCDRCETTQKYDPKMCKFIEQQTLFKDKNITDKKVYENIEVTSNACKQKEHQEMIDSQVTLPCCHQWCRECLFQNYQQQLRALCYCGYRYSTNIFDRRIKAEEFDQIYKRQLSKIMQETNLSWQFCKSNCGFFYTNQNNDQNFSYCLECDKIQKCYKCQEEVFSQYLTINDCNHNYHLLCTLDLLTNNKLKDLSCGCGQQLDIQKKAELNIECIKCKKYSDNLIMFDCYHFIHKQCFEQNLTEYLSFQCPICKVPIYNTLQKLELEQIKEQLYQLKEKEERDKKEFCLKCGKRDHKLIKLNCSHTYHQKCLEVMKQNYQKCVNCGDQLQIIQTTK